jgi:cation diffusion facilitator CzcD-associated flavoprotein CzcO
MSDAPVTGALAADRSALESVPHASAKPLPETVEIAIVGAGFGGLGMAIRLRQQGVHDFVVLERAADVGGTWAANTYPGCQCDVPSNLYSFSFAPNPEWTHSYPLQPQIQRYLRRCAERFGILEHIRLGCEMQEAAWDGAAGRWRIDTSSGRLSAKVLVAAPGLLSEPTAPPIPGLDRFAGTVFHTARWDHGHDLTGERVALVGTGATAIQAGPQIRPKVARLHVFQRTPGWVLPHPDHAIPRGLRRLYARAPALQRLARRGVYAMREALAAGMTHHLRLLRLVELVARAQLRLQVRDRAMRAQLTPHYDIGCKRVLLSNDWYPMLTAPNTELVTAAIAEVRERSIVTADGVERPVDAIILATGFRPTDPPIAYRLRGAEGRLLADVWSGSPQAYLGTAISGFPNLFLLYGPNLNLGHSSIVYMLESQIHYVRQAIALLQRGDVNAVDVRPAVQRAYNEDIARQLSGTVWDAGGCASWYLDANGRNSTMWPDYTFRYRRRVDRFDVADYDIALATRSPAPTTA